MRTLFNAGGGEALSVVEVPVLPPRNAHHGRHAHARTRTPDTQHSHALSVSTAGAARWQPGRSRVSPRPHYTSSSTQATYACMPHPATPRPLTSRRSEARTGVGAAQKDATHSLTHVQRTQPGPRLYRNYGLASADQTRRIKPVCVYTQTDTSISHHHPIPAPRHVGEAATAATPLRYPTIYTIYTCTPCSARMHARASPRSMLQSRYIHMGAAAPSKANALQCPIPLSPLHNSCYGYRYRRVLPTR